MEQLANESLQVITRSKSGQLSEKERLAIEMKYLGKTSEEIGSVTGYNPDYTRQLFMAGGRLEKSYQEYALCQQAKGQNHADTVLNTARDEAYGAITRMIELSKNPEINEAVRYKANEYLLTVSGTIAGSSLHAFLSGKSFEEVKRLCDEASVKLFGKPMSGFQLVIEDSALVQPKVITNNEL